VARAVGSERLDLAHIGDLALYARNGVAVPLSQIAHVEYAHEEPILWRINRDMAITVRSDVIDGVQPPDVTSAIWPKLQSIRDGLEPAYRIEIGGAIEESQKGNASFSRITPKNSRFDFTGNWSITICRTDHFPCTNKRRTLKLIKFPNIFPERRELWDGDGLDHDCVLSQHLRY
jgi:hypothetical protein